MNILPEWAWWSGASRWYFNQPVAHFVGGVAFALFAQREALPHPVEFAAAAALFWQLLNEEQAPDGTYPWRWLVYDVIVATTAAFLTVRFV